MSETPTTAAVQVVAPDGTPGTVPQEDLQTALAQGYKLDTPEAAAARDQAAQRTAQIEGPLGIAKTFGEATARSLTQPLGGTLGLVGSLLGHPEIGKWLTSDYWLEKAGVKPEDIEARKEANPITALAGNVTGAIAPVAAAVATGGASAAPEVAGELGGEAAAEGAGTAAAEGAGAAGAAATGDAGADAAVEATPLAKRMAKASAVGAAYGAGDPITEDDLGETQATADKVFAGGVLGALTGAGTEGLFALGERVIPPVIDRAAALADKLGGLSKDAISAVLSKTSNAPQSEIRAALDAGVADPGIFDAERQATAAAEFKAARKDAQSAAKVATQKNVTQAASDLTDAMQEKVDAINDLSNAAFRKRTEETADLLGNHDPKVAQAAASKFSMDAHGVLDSIRADPVKYGYERPIAKAEQLLQDFDKNAFSVGKTFQSSADYYNGIQELRQKLDPFLEFGATPSPEAVDTVNALKTGLRTAAKKTLEDASVWGPAGERTAEFNASYSAMRGDRDAILKAIGTKTETPTGALERRLTPSKVETWLKGTVKDTTKARETQALFDRYEASSKAFLEQAQKTFRRTDVAAPDAEELEQLFGKVAERRAAGLGAIQHPVAPAEVPLPPELVAKGLGKYDKGSLLEGGGALALGHAMGVHMPGLGIAATLAEGARSPLSTVRTLSRLASVAKKTSGAIRSGIGGFLSSPTVRGELTVGVEDALQRHTMTAAASGKRRDTAYARRADEIRNLAANPQMMQGLLERHTGRLTEAAPKLSLALQTKAVQAVQHLASKLPPQPQAGLQLEPEEPSESEKSDFAAALRATHQPLSILDDLRAGVLSPDAVDTVKTLYPQLHQEIASEVLRQIADHPKRTLSYEHRLQLGTLLGAPVDGISSPDFIAWTQGLHAQARATAAVAAAPQGSPKTTRKGLSGLRMAQTLATPSQQRQLAAQEEAAS